MRVHLLSILLCVLVSLHALAQGPQFELKQRVGMEFKSASSLAFDSKGYMYLFNHEFMRLNTEGKHDQSFSLQFTSGQEYSSSVLIDAEDNFYFINVTQGRIEKFSPEGKFLLSFDGDVATSRFRKIYSGVALDKQGNIFVVQYESNIVRKYNTLGKLIGTIELRTQRSIDENFLINIIPDDAGNIYTLQFNDNKVVKFSPEGDTLQTFGIRADGSSLLKKTIAFALDEDEKLYVADSEEQKIFAFEKDGSLSNTDYNSYLPDGNFRKYFHSLTLGKDGHLYVAGRLGRQEKPYPNVSIVKLDKSGQRVAQWGDTYDPQDLVINEYGEAYLLNRSGRITKFNSQGEPVLDFGSGTTVGPTIEFAQGIALDRQNNVYVLSSAVINLNVEKSHVAAKSFIYKFNSSGKLVATYNDFGPIAWQLTAIDVDASGNIYVASYDHPEAIILKINANGKFIKSIGTYGLEYGQIWKPVGLKVDILGNLYVLDMHGSRVQKFDPSGKVLFESKSFARERLTFYGTHMDIDIDDRGTIYVSSWEVMTPDRYTKNWFTIYNAKGEITYQQEHNFANIAINKSGSTLLLGKHKSEAFSAYTSTIIQSPSHFIRGTVFNDKNSNCQYDAGENGLSGIIIEAQPGPYYSVSNEAGEYTMPISAGTFTLQQIVPKLAGRTITPVCEQEQVVTVASSASVETFNLANTVSDTPVLTAHVASDRRRRCFPSLTKITYGNEGFASAASTQVHYQLPQYVALISADKPYTRAADGSYVFNVGTLQPGQRGVITIIDSVICGIEEIRGLTICAKAWITPSVKPLPFLTGSCNAQGGSVRFVIRNPTPSPMSEPKIYKLFVDGRPSIINNYQLAAGDSLVLAIPATGQTMRLEADLADGKEASSTVEACRSSQLFAFSTGFVNAMPPNDPDPAPAYAEECLPILDSYDPNDKQVVPTGLTDQRYTPTGAALWYKIRFQNTGTDVAYRVVVVDTLSPYLDISTLQVGAVSHNYRFSVSGQGQPVLTWIFNNIMLPDSNANEPASHGFINFSIKPRTDLPEKTAIENWADIYFDYNSPVRTDTTLNRIYDMPPVIAQQDRLLPEEVEKSPRITTFEPEAGKAGAQVTIRGEKFSPHLPANKVYINGIQAQVLTGNDSSLVVRVPQEATSGKIKIQTDQAGVISTKDFTVYPAPLLNSFNPAEGITGTEVILRGHNLSADMIESVYLGGELCEIIGSEPTSLTLRVPAGAISGTFTVHTKGGEAQTTASFRLWHAPTLLSLDKPMQKVGGTLLLLGEHFAPEAARNRVHFGVIPAPVLKATEKELLVKVPDGAHSGLIRLTTPGGEASIPIDVIPAPLIAEVSPSRASVGMVIELKGQHFLTLDRQDTVRFGGVEATVLSASTTRMQVRVPRGAISGELTVSGSGGEAEAPFTVEALSLQESITMYPNPTQGRFTLNFMRADFDIETVQIYDVLGKLVYSANHLSRYADLLDINLENQAKGVYLLQIRTEWGMVARKLTLL